MTPLDKPLKRALKIDGRDYVVTLTPDALKITRKGHRLGVELEWLKLVSGESALAVALHASIGKPRNPQTQGAKASPMNAGSGWMAWPPLSNTGSLLKGACQL
jgi:hypothetical protein